MEADRLFSRPLGPHCGPCPLLDVCGAERTDNACPTTLDLAGRGGPFLLHPLRTDFDEHFDRVGGAGFDDIVGRTAAAAPVLASYVPQVRWLVHLRREQLTATEVPVVTVRLKEVFRGGRIRGAAELRAYTGLGADVAIVLLLHGEDDLLEHLVAADLAAQIAAGGYALVTAPSFSLWEPQRRPDNLLSLRRSLLYYVELQAAGAAACPRVGWVEAPDVERLASWVNRHDVSFVSLDLMTYDGPSFDRAVGGLARFDELTERRRRYLIDGVRAQRKIESIYLAVEPARVSLSSATMAGLPPEIDGVRTNTVLARAASISALCDAAAHNVAAAHSSTVEQFIRSTLAGPKVGVPRRPSERYVYRTDGSPHRLGKVHATAEQEHG